MTFKLPKPAFAVSPVLALGGAPTGARADSVTTVPSFFCAGGAHVAYRPAGSTIVIRSRWAEQTLGTLTSFLNAQTTTLSINGGPPIDGTNLYSVPFSCPPPQACGSPDSIRRPGSRSEVRGIRSPSIHVT
jgi:hypothetical protein